MHDISLLKLLSTKANYEKYKRLLPKEGPILSETRQLLADYEAYFRTFPADSEIDWDKFNVFTGVSRRTGWKQEKVDAFRSIVERVRDPSAGKPDVAVIDYFNRVLAASKIQELASDVIGGTEHDFSGITKIIEQSNKDVIGIDDVSSLFGPTDLTSILEKRIRSGGLEWRLDCMNRAAGPLHEGDFVFLAARPEAGKTSWLCSELTHMVKFLDADKDAVIFNPEEGGGRVLLRLITAAIGEDVLTVASDEASAKARYEAEVGRFDRIRVAEPPGGISVRDIERILEKGNYGLVAINVVDKIKLPPKFYQEKEVDRYRSLAYWLREAANRYEVPILAVGQADASADGQRYLTQNMLYGSKTGVQGEIDLLLGMGYDPTIESRRFISLLKNKLPGGPKTDPLLKHAKLEVEFEPHTGRYRDI